MKFAIRRFHFDRGSSFKFYCPKTRTFRKRNGIKTKSGVQSLSVEGEKIP